ncbi:MAG: hypothetical protein IJT73_08105 [Selenomonadaceae bacterium]|nr:hypothetical protein [Selenomonadaceae bacterium]
MAYIAPGLKSTGGFRKIDWLTIPEAPNYEINGYFKIRNKTTGKLLKLQRRKNPKHTPFAALYNNGRTVQRVVTAFYNSAVVHAKGGDFVPIKSLDNLYEISCDSDEVRNTKTKEKISPRIRGNYINFGFQIRRNGKIKIVHKSLNQLYLEVFGYPYRRKRRPVQVVARQPNHGIGFNGNGYCFKSIKDAKGFLAAKTRYTATWIRKLLNHRKTEIDGWLISYIEGG